MMMEGFVSLHRKVAEWEWYTDPVIPRVFFHCLLFANYKDAEWRGIHIKRGQFFTSYTNIASSLKLTTKQVRYAIDRMISTKEIQRKRCGNGMLITISNYDVYQLSLADLWQTFGRPLATTNNNNKNNNKDTKVSMPAKPTLEIDFDALKDYFNETVKDTEIRQIVTMTPIRRSMIHKRAMEHGKDAVAKVIVNAARSNFLNGDNNRHFLATFDWLMRPSNFIKVLEGNYANK